MNFLTHRLTIWFGSALLVAAGLTLMIFMAAYGLRGHAFAATDAHQKGKLITIYDRGTTKVVVTKEHTIGQVLKDEGVVLDAHDTVEPSTSTKMVASSYDVNIYRSRPVLVIDGATKMKVMTPYQTAPQIAKDAGITLYPEDTATIQPITGSEMTAEGAGLEMVVHRATQLNLELYGSTTPIRTQAKTVGDMLKEKGIKLAKQDHVTPVVSTPITVGMLVNVWREGVQTITVAEPVPFSVQKVPDGDRPAGYSAIQTPGQNGSQKVTYQIDIEGGQEVSRVKIASIVTQAPVAEVEVIGVKSSGGLTKSKGADQFTDSNGVTHRETYYDLNMHTVAGSCPGNSTYTIRDDGVKVDQSGYVMVAANLGNYPRCSIVETSVGLAKVYDTGGFASRYPYAFDIATDWSDYNGV